MKPTSGILLAGGTGSRLAPLNQLFNKHMVPIYEKYIIDYPLDTMKNMGVKDLTIVLGGNHFSQVVSHVKDGNHFGMNVNYIYQEKAAGIAQAINLCGRFINGPFAVVLGDNIFENPVVWDNVDKPQIVLSNHFNLTGFGVASLKDNQIIKIEEKPKKLEPEFDQYAITGCYLFDNQFFEFFEELTPSARGEYEITDIINLYKKNNNLHYTFSNGFWSDAGTHESIKIVNNHFFKKDHE